VGVTYAEYVYRQAPAEARKIVETYDDQRLLATSPDDMSAELFEQFAIPKHQCTDDEDQRWVDPDDPLKGLVVSVGFEPSPRALDFLALQGSRHQNGFEPTLKGDRLEVLVTDSRYARRAIDAIRANVSQRNKDIDRSNGDLRTHLANVVTSFVRNAEERRDARDRARADAERSGIRFAGQPSSESSLEPTSVRIGAAVAQATASVTAAGVGKLNLMVITDPNRWAQADQVIDQLLRAINAALDDPDIGEVAHGFLAEEIRPLVLILQQLVRTPASDKANRLDAVARAAAVGGQVVQGVKDARRLLGDGAGVARDLAIVAALRDDLVDGVETAIRWIA
jgi:hypothetical protein